MGSNFNQLCCLQLPELLHMIYYGYALHHIPKQNVLLTHENNKCMAELRTRTFTHVQEPTEWPSNTESSGKVARVFFYSLSLHNYATDMKCFSTTQIRFQWTRTGGDSTITFICVYKIRVDVTFTFTTNWSILFVCT